MASASDRFPSRRKLAYVIHIGRHQRPKHCLDHARSSRKDRIPSVEQYRETLGIFMVRTLSVRYYSIPTIGLKNACDRRCSCRLVFIYFPRIIRFKKIILFLDQYCLLSDDAPLPFSIRMNEDVERERN